MDDRLRRLNALNKTLDLARDLSGVFLPPESPKQFDVMFVAEMPFMNVPKDWIEGQPIPNFAETARDKFLQDMMIKYGVTKGRILRNRRHGRRQHR
jgi:hypothetical protein